MEIDKETIAEAHEVAVANIMKTPVVSTLRPARGNGRKPGNTRTS